MSTSKPADWYVLVQGRAQGPFDDARLKALAAQRRIAPSTQVRRGEGAWRPAEQVPGLFPSAAPPSAAAPPRAKSAPAPLQAQVVATAAVTTSLQSPARPRTSAGDRRKRNLAITGGATAAGLLIFGAVWFAISSTSRDDLPEVAAAAPFIPTSVESAEPVRPTPMPAAATRATIEPGTGSPPPSVATATDATPAAVGPPAIPQVTIVTEVGTMPATSPTTAGGTARSPTTTVPLATEFVNASPLPDDVVRAFREHFLFAWTNDGTSARCLPLGIWAGAPGEAVIAQRDYYRATRSRLCDVNGQNVRPSEFTAVLPGKDLALMKTDRTTAAPPLPIGPAAKPGDLVYALGIDERGAFGVSACGCVEHRVTGAELAEEYSKQTKQTAFWDHDGRYFQVKFDVPPPFAYLLLNDVGQVVGLRLTHDFPGAERSNVVRFSLPDDPASKTYHVLSAEYIAELTSSRRPMPIALADHATLLSISLSRGKVALSADQEAEQWAPYANLDPQWPLTDAQLQDLKTCLVRIAFGTSRIKDYMPGILLDDEGHVVTFVSPLDFTKFPCRVEFPLDNSTAEVLGYDAVLAGRHLLLLKTTATGRKPKVRHFAGPSALKEGDPLYIVDWSAVSKLTIGEISTAVDVVGLPGKKNRDTRWERYGSWAPTTVATVMRSSRGGDLPGTVVIDGSGALVGISMPLKVDTNVCFAVSGVHFRELLLARSPQVKPLTELAGIEALKETKQRGARRPWAVPQRPTDAQLAAAASPSAPPPVPAATATPTAAAVDPNAPPAPVPVELGTPEKLRSLADFRLLVVDRKSLFDQADAINDRIQGFRTDADEVDAEYRRLDVQAMPLYQEMEKLRRLISNQRFLRSQSTDPADRADWSATIAANEQLLSSLDSQYQALVRVSLPLKKRYGELMRKIAGEQAQLNELSKAGDRLRRRFIAAVHPYEVDYLPAAPEFATYFAELIDADLDAPLGYAARACTEIRAGRLDEAAATLDKSIVLAPKEAYYIALRGTVRHRQGRLAEASKDFSDALRLEKNLAPAHYVFAVASLRNGAYAQFEAEMKAALKADPNDLDALLLPAFVKAATDDDKVRNVDYARRLLAQAVEASAPADRRRTLVEAAIAAADGDGAKGADLLDSAKSKTADPAVAAQLAAWSESLRAGKPLRVDFKTFDAWTLW